MVTVKILGAEALSGSLGRGLKSFQRQQKVQMREAVKAVKVDVVHQVRSTFPSRGLRGLHKGLGGQKIGPLERNIGTKVFSSTLNVIGLIRPKAKAFYGRFQETGLNVMRKGRITKATANLRKGLMRRNEGHPFRLPQKKYLEPVAKRVGPKVAEIMGRAYRVFYRGGA